jgi:exosome complex component CSL4
MSSKLLRFEIGATVTPGDRLGSLRGVIPGVGTYARGGHVFASRVGRVLLDTDNQDMDDTATSKTTPMGVVSVLSSKAVATCQVLVKGQLVLCRVLRIMLQQVAVEIIAAAAPDASAATNGFQLQHKPEATIRREDVRQQGSSSSVAATASNEIKLESCFRPGDWVLARIVSLGDARRYLISTAETELGVVRAVSSSVAADHTYAMMRPISWNEMECPVTGRKESRKVARARPEMLKQVLKGMPSNK